MNGSPGSKATSSPALQLQSSARRKEVILRLRNRDLSETMRHLRDLAEALEASGDEFNLNWAADVRRNMGALQRAVNESQPKKGKAA